jgi:hypothetical protein
MASVLGLLTLGAATSTTTSVIASITSISNNVITLLGHITSIGTVSSTSKQSDIIILLNKSDIEATLKLFHAIILEIPPTYDMTQVSSVLISLNNVKDIISKIEAELKDIHTKIEYNSNLYIMASFRSYTYSSNLENIKNYIAILDRRVDYMFKILDISRNFNKVQL